MPVERPSRADSSSALAGSQKPPPVPSPTWERAAAKATRRRSEVEVAHAAGDVVEGEWLAEGEDEVGAAGVLAVDDEGLRVGPGVAVAARVVADDEDVGADAAEEVGGGAAGEVAAPGEAEGGARLAQLGQRGVGAGEELAAEEAARSFRGQDLGLHLCKSISRAVYQDQFQ